MLLAAACVINQTWVTYQTDSLSRANVQTDLLFSMENLTKTKKYMTIKKKKKEKKSMQKGMTLCREYQI